MKIFGWREDRVFAVTSEGQSIYEEIKFLESRSKAKTNFSHFPGWVWLA